MNSSITPVSFGKWLCRSLRNLQAHMGDPYISLNLPLRTGIIGFLEGIVSLIHHLLVRSRAEDYELLEERSPPSENAAKLAIVTGGTTGIGFEIALGLSRCNYQVVVAARNQERGEEAAKRISLLTNNSKIRFVSLDISSISSVEAFCKVLSKDNLKISFLISAFGFGFYIDNAGIYQKSFVPIKLFPTAGAPLESQFATNNIGTLALTNILQPLFSTDIKVINLGSIAHYAVYSPIDYVEFQAEVPLSYCLYSVTKLLSHSLTLDLVQNRNIEAYTIHPGLVMTEIFRGNPTLSWILEAILWRFASYLMLSPKQGSITALQVALAPSGTFPKSSFVADGDQVYDANPRAVQEVECFLKFASDAIKA